MSHVCNAWLAALERRHLANLTGPELTRALRALSSCYVERRNKLARGAALSGAGKRAAFAAFYGPLHFLTVTEIVRALGACNARTDTIIDLGCGTGAGSAAWALACHSRPRIIGVDRNAWAISEANWTYRELRATGSAKNGDITTFNIAASASTAVLLAYAVNEIDPESRSHLLTRLVHALRGGSRLLIVEAIAMRDKPWWREWTGVLGAAGARADEWRFEVEIPAAVRELGRRAGLALKELSARTIARV
ncbi:MAG TPA: class I SAM-dependent methyltransferase [Vicinamibacterales bacterium]